MTTRLSAIALLLLLALLVAGQALANEGAPEQPAPANHLKLDDSLTVTLKYGEPRLEQLPDGGIRIHFTVTPKMGAKPRFTLRKQFTPKITPTSLTFRFSEAVGRTWIEAVDPQKGMAFRDFNGSEEVRIEVADLKYKGKDEPFSGEISSFMISFALEKDDGDHTVDILELDIQQ